MTWRTTISPFLTAVGRGVLRSTYGHGRSIAVGLALAGGFSGCGGSTNDVEMSAAAENYLDEMLDLMQQHSVNRQKIDWTSFRDSVFHAGADATNVADLSRDAIPTALRLLGDHASFYTAADGSQVMNPDPLSCTDPPAPVVTAPPEVGYVAVAPCGRGQGEGQACADAMYQQFAGQDSRDLAGWIVDLRHTAGGNMYGMIGGLATLLGDGEFGSFVDVDRKNVQYWGYHQGQVTAAGYPYLSASALRLIRPDPKVAVLTDCSVAGGGGEAVAISFRGRPLTRSFGTPTHGQTVARQSYALSDGGSLVLVAWTMADRTKTLYGGPIVPDELVRDPAQAAERAIAWLRE